MRERERETKEDRKRLFALVCGFDRFLRFFQRFVFLFRFCHVPFLSFPFSDGAFYVHIFSVLVCGERNLAERLSVRIDQERSLFEFRQTAEYVPVLLILDRREDPVTPLLNQWTYEAMTHELLGMRNNRVSLRGSPGVRSDGMEVVLDARTDDFYRRNMYLNFGELGDNVKHFVDAFQVREEERKERERERKQKREKGSSSSSFSPAVQQETETFNVL